MSAAAKLALEQAEQELKIAVEAMEALYKRGYEMNNVTDSDIRKAHELLDEKRKAQIQAFNHFSEMERLEHVAAERAEHDARLKAFLAEREAETEARAKQAANK